MNSVNSSQLQLPLREAEGNYNTYPPPLKTYEDVVGSREIFMDTLKQLHASMGTKFMIPIVGGKDLDLHRLFVEVTSRGGIAKVMKERKWKEITGVFNFPSSATNASFILRKYYVTLIYHFEQIYLFKAKYWTPLSNDAFQQGSTATTNPPAPPEQTSASSRPEAPATGSPVCGVIDGKFESGYLITVKIGSEDFKGVLYQVPANEAQTSNGTQMQRSSSQNIAYASPRPEVPTRRKRRKKSEIRKRDPAHPKPNRSGYNFFFAEQHARLKPLYHGRDREISRMIGELWNKLPEPERAVYQEKAFRDKERYKVEMQDYREKLKNGQIVRNAVPVHQQQPEVNLADYIEEINETSSYKSEKSNMEECGSVDKESDFGEFSQVDMGLKNVNVEMLADEEAFELQTGVERVGQDERHIVDGKSNVVLAQDGISVPIEERIDS